MYVTVHNPRRGLGAAVNKGGLIASGAGIATTAVVSSVGAGTALGAWAGPIGAGAGAIIGIIAGLWAAHNARVKGAKAENTVVNSVVQAFDQVLKAIFAAANSTDPLQNITGAQAASQCQQLLAQCWQQLAQVKGMPGVSDNSGGGATCGTYTPGVTTRCSPGHPCGKSCTAGCCVGCNDLWPTILDAIVLFQNPNGGTLNTCTVYGSSYGASQRSGYSLTYKPPVITAALSSTLSTVGGTLASDLGIAPSSTVAGIPSWLLAVAGAGFLLWKMA